MGFLRTRSARPYATAEDDAANGPRGGWLRSHLLRRAWGSRVRSWDHHVQSSPAFDAVLDAVVARAEPQVTDRVVDLGAGTGYVSLALAPKVDRVVAADLAKPMVDALAEKAASRSLGNVHPIVVDLSHLELPESSVDLVVSNYALHHLTDDDKVALVARASRWLRPGGRLVVADMMFGRGTSQRDRAIIRRKLVSLARLGPGGLWRIVKNAWRFSVRRGTEMPASPEFWQGALSETGFEAISFDPVVAEAGVIAGQVTERA
jgi:ubiquinone/menaquinone biosynthesis C-methylase UbiE